MEIYGNSFGNFLSSYWHVRAYCIYKNIDFDFSKFIILDTYKLPQSNCIKQNWAKYLSYKTIKENYDNKSYHISNKIIINDYIKTYYKLTNNKIDIDKFTNGNKEFLLWSHIIVGTWTSIIDIISCDTEKAIIKCLNSKQLEIPKYEENEIVIHFRTGNVLIGHANPDYPILKFKYFYDIIKKESESKKITKVTIIWKIPYNNKDTKFQNGDFNRDKYVIVSLKEYLQKTIENINVEIENNYFSDFIYMFYAPILIISPSSFGFWAGIASRNICYSPICSLLCNNQTPNIRNNFYWKSIKNYYVDCHCAYRTQKNNEAFVQKLNDNL